jgi:hypothetical protein
MTPGVQVIIWKEAVALGVCGAVQIRSRRGAYMSRCARWRVWGPGHKQLLIGKMRKLLTD